MFEVSVLVQFNHFNALFIFTLNITDLDFPNVETIT